jgi:hypothetical protein
MPVVALTAGDKFIDVVPKLIQAVQLMPAFARKGVTKGTILSPKYVIFIFKRRARSHASVSGCSAAPQLHGR